MLFHGTNRRFPMPPVEFELVRAVRLVAGLQGGRVALPPRVLVLCQEVDSLQRFILILVSAATCGQGSGARSELAVRHGQ